MTERDDDFGRGGQNPTNSGEENIDLLAWVYKILAHWYWFVAWVILMVFAGWLYLRYSTPVYQTTAKLLVVDEKRGGGLLSGGIMDDFGGMMGIRSNVDNEVEVLKTFDLMREVVGALNAHITYIGQGRIKEAETLDPFVWMEVVTPIDSIHRAFEFSLSANADKTVSLKAKEFELNAIKLDELISIPQLGFVRFTRNLQLLDTSWMEQVSARPLGIRVRPPAAQTASFRENLTVGVTNKQTSTIDLSFNHPIPRRGEQILGTLIERYVIRTLEDKNTVADSTLAFIDNRLQFVGAELGLAEDRIQTFKQESQLADISAQSQILIENASAYAKDLAAVESQLLMIDEVDRYLADTRNLRVVPTTVSGNDPTFAALVQNYNKLLLDRERMLMTSTEANPFVVNLDQQIAGLRADMRTNLSSARRQLQVTRDGLARQSRQMDAEIRRVPATERGFIDLTRQQQIKQELYLYLQQKWEETAIGKTANISNSKVIDSPRSGEYPISPKRNIIYLACFLLGLLIPFGILYVQELLNVRIRTKEDITRRTHLPIIGEVGHNPEEEANNIVVTRESRAPIAEQFRALRTNLDFFAGRSGNHTILFTSSMSGEGKSFVAVNLAIALALSGKRVVLVEFDLRKPSVSAKLGLSNSFGYTNYILKEELTVADILKPSGVHEGLDLISSGPIPPNPAEIILHDRTRHLFEELRMRYDYIVIDSPPVGVVTDAQLLSKYADSTLYVVRQNVTFKKQIEIPNDISRHEKMPRVQLLVNDIEVSRGYGYGGYGYGSGYGYGYGYYAQEKKKKKWYWPF